MKSVTVDLAVDSQFVLDEVYGVCRIGRWFQLQL